MSILIVSVPLEFPLANYCLAAQLASAPETKGQEIKILNLDTTRLNSYKHKNSEIWRFIAHVDAEQPEIITFSVYLWNTLIIRELVAILARLYPHIALIAGGPELMTREAAEQWLNDGNIVAAIRGEGEATIVEVVQRLAAGSSLRGVASCSWRDGTTVVHETPRRTSKVIEFPSPYLTGWIPDDLFDRLDGQHSEGRFPRAFIETYRGCYMKCSYCQWSSTRRSMFPLPRVLGELTWVLSKRIARLFVVDSMFGFSISIAKEILLHIIHEREHHGASTNIVCYHNQDFFDEELFDLYRRADVTVEIDLQSSDKDVLTRLGRGRWLTDHFDRHLELFRRLGVKTTGSADLIIGLPGDRLRSFEASVDHILRQGIDVGLYQTSIIPGTHMARSVEEDGVLYSPVAPRAVFRTVTFPVREMVQARLIGHGVDFFRRYPRTAQALWRFFYDSPVSLCKAVGQRIWDQYDLMYGESWQYATVISGMRQAMEKLVRELCRSPRLTDVLVELFLLEAAACRFTMPGDGARRLPVQPVRTEWCSGTNWLAEAPFFRRDRVEIVSLHHRVDVLLHKWQEHGSFLPEEEWLLPRDNAVALVYLSKDGEAKYHIVDSATTLELLDRFNGYFSVEDCLSNLAGTAWRSEDLSLLWIALTQLGETGLIVPGSWAWSHRFE